MRYMMLIHHDEPAMAAADQKQLWQDYAAFNEALNKAVREGRRRDLATIGSFPASTSRAGSGVLTRRASGSSASASARSSALGDASRSTGRESPIGSSTASCRSSTGIIASDGFASSSPGEAIRGFGWRRRIALGLGNGGRDSAGPSNSSARRASGAGSSRPQSITGAMPR